MLLTLLLNSVLLSSNSRGVGGCNPPRPTVMLGEVLVEKGVISQDQLQIALTEQKRQSKPLGKLLVDLGFVTESIMRDMLSETLGQASVDLSKVVVDSEAVKLVSKDFAKQVNMLPIAYDREKNHLTVAMANTFNVVALDKLRSILGDDVEIKVLLAGEIEIDNAIDNFFGFELSVDGILRELETGEVDAKSLSSEEYSQPLLRLVDSILSDAAKRGASDIHFEPEERFFRIRYRIDGVLRQIRSLHKKYQSMITVRIKVLAGLNIAESRVPQDGHISLQIFGYPVDFRVSCMATTHGENIVLRILDRRKGIIPLEEMSLSDYALSQIKLIMARPVGIILVTGPTGSGKTTTLYSILNAINDESINIMTLEDPVEYPMAQIRQATVNTAAKMGFADGIRAILRQDPDVILVGEIRDKETAEMALRAAMTGHQVYSTVHANSAIKALTRLMDIGVPKEVLSGHIIGIIGQRLVRKLCHFCREPYHPTPMERRLLGLTDHNSKIIIYRPKGCKYCDYHGYKGRMALMEILNIDSELDNMIAKGANHQEILTYALENGFNSLAIDGARAILERRTSLDEVTRIVDLTERLGR
ncbi:MAG: GspE/PulE family protein [Magnetococcus sp. DMHC-6]